MRVVLAFLCALFLSACSTTKLEPVTQGPISDALEEDYFQVKIPTHDGKELAATVYQPKLEPGQTAPVIITTHGFGGFRAKRPLSIYGKTMITGEAALAAWKKGYWVVFYEQRGWGDSDDVVHMLDPELEIRDVSTVLDWTLEHIQGISKINNEWAIGMIGESYGGGAQTIASFNEPRLKAIVPIATWYNLNAMAPHQHMKTNWGANLVVMGGISSGFDTGFTFAKPMRSAFTGTVSRDAMNLMYERSPAWYCDQGLTPKSDALFVQGFRDSLFPFQEALKNQECFEKGGNDTRVIAMQGGHILPWPVQKWSGKPLFNTDDAIHCGEYEETLPNAIVAWWDEKLKGEEATVPELCITLDYETGLANEDFPQNSETFPVPNSKLTIPLSGLFEWLMIPMDQGFDIARKIWWPGADRRFLRPNGGFGRPKFIPLYIAHDNEVLSGIPKINISMDGSASKMSTRAFVGIGIQHANTRRVWVASEQLTPLPKKGNYEQDLPAISTPLKDGDRVGLIVYGYSWHYMTNPSFWFSRARVRGEASLPIIELPDE
ncbi:MAG: CocE/NonD family hydrolase [Alcanivoracaceae bacterium]|nr:CocE/NonD family hydrolase [Alcanivoracaceae bacterium]